MVETDEIKAGKKLAGQYARLKRKVGPMLKELEKLGDDLKAVFRAHPGTNVLGDVGFSVTSRTVLDNKAIRAELGARMPQFEKIIPVENLALLRKGR